jgi:hypothetical protein
VQSSGHPGLARGCSTVMIWARKLPSRDRMDQLRNLAFGDIAAARHQAWPAGTVIS